MKLILFQIFLLFSFNLSSQVFSLKVDTTDAANTPDIEFIKKYFQQDTISTKYWLNAKAGAKYYNHNHLIDWIWRSLSPKEILDRYHVQVIELDQLNDSLSYFTVLITDNRKDKYAMYNIYKFYIVRNSEGAFIDNCMEYELHRFNRYDTENISFYISPRYNIAENELKKASQRVDSLYGYFKRTKPEEPFRYFVCATQEEMQILCNIVSWNGYVGGFTNMEEDYIVAHSNNPYFGHEFVHVVLGIGAPCFFLGEGIASLYGGFSKQTLSEAIAELKECYINKVCNFTDLYNRKSYSEYNNNMTYAFAAVICRYIINNYGLDTFLEMYYDESITTENFLKKLSVYVDKKEMLIKREIEEEILE